MFRQAVILAGGLGTRLRSILSDRPKAMAVFNDRPFLEYQLGLLKSGGVQEVVMCLGYMADVISSYVGDGARWGLCIRYSVESSPLGTGGALKLAESLLDETFLLLNGDTFLSCDLGMLEEHHWHRRADVTLTVCRSDDATRYGSVKVKDGGRVTEFCEKVATDRPEYANAGLYVMSKALLATIPARRLVSLEQELLEGWVKARRVFAFMYQGGFVDIGTPEGHEQFVRLATESGQG